MRKFLAFRDLRLSRLGRIAAGGITLIVTSYTLEPFSTTATAPEGKQFVAGAVVIVIPVKPGSYGTAGAVDGTITTGGMVTEDTSGDVAAAILLAGWAEDDTPTLTVRTDVETASVAASPEILSHADTATSTSTTGATIAMPATAPAGTLLASFIAVDGVPTITVPGDWTVVSETSQSTFYKRLIVTKIASGSDTLALTFSAGETASAKTLAITAGATMTLGAQTTGMDAGALDMGTSEETLWLDWFSHDGTASHVGTGDPPAGYAWLGTIAQGLTSTAAAASHIAYRTATGAIENPGAPSVASATTPRSQVIALRL